MPRWLKIALIILILIGLTLLYLLLPEQDDLAYLATAGDNYNAEILRDSYGVPHIFGQTDADAAYGLAYAHAEDDFLTIQQALIAARGQLATIYGLDAAPNDYMVQLLRIWDVTNAHYASSITPAEKAIVEAYAAGLNHYAALHEDEALPGLFPVTGQDVVAGFIHRLPLFFGIDGALGELFAEERAQNVSNKETGDWRLEIVSLQSPVSNLPYNSNTFAVAPSRTANGETFFNVNSHQPWEGIAAWYEAHIHSEEGLDMVGGLLPGSPLITHGHNRHVSWAFTVNSPDLIDIYVLDINPDDPNQYRFEDQWLDLEVREAPLTVKLFGRFRWTVKREVLWSVYGPTVRQDHGTYAIRFAGMGHAGHIEQFLRLNKATNLAEWQAAMAEGYLPMFNAGYADVEGNIYYLYNGRIPLRAEGYNWEQYLPGNTSETLWTEYLPFDQLPQVLNPPSGFIQNSNNTPFRTTIGAGNPDPANFSPTLGIELDISNRALRSLELFGSDDTITAEEFYQYKYDDTYSADSDVPLYIQQLLNAPPPDDANVQQALEILRDWDLTAREDSMGTTIAILMLNFVNNSEAAHINPSMLVNHPVTTEVLMDSLTQAVNVLIEHFGRVDVPWQEVNRLRRGDVDLGLGGAPDVLHAVYGQLEEDGRFRGIAGDSYVMLITWLPDGSVRSRSIHQYGSATLVEQSPHYADQAQLFVTRGLKPVWFDEVDIRANLERAYQPGEELEGGN
ncbi:MAG: acylase [Ardenticatenaceae bacterium]|nr:acylase [Ardenticatenaceae bacterium]